MRLLVPILAAAMLSATMAAYYLSDAQAKKREVRAALSNFEEAVASKDRAKVSELLNTLLTDDAKIRLNVRFFAIGDQPPAMSQDMDKKQFIKFIDDTLYPLTDYGYKAALLSLDHESGLVNFTSGEFGDGKDMMGGLGIEMRYSSNTECTGKAIFDDAGAKLAEAACDIFFRKVPKPGQVEGLSQQGLNLMKR